MCASRERVEKARVELEHLLVHDKEETADTSVKMFNLSRGDPRKLLNRSVDALLAHTGWQACYDRRILSDPFFGKDCPVRRNYELLESKQVRERLEMLFSLCYYNGLHIPIRQILLLLANALLGHPDSPEGLMQADSTAVVLRKGTRSKASLYGNVFGQNLPEERRRDILIFDYLSRFRIGYETTNRIDGILIYGALQEEDRHNYERFVKADTFYGADEAYESARDAYIDARDEDETRTNDFLQHLVRQRRGLFFRIPADEADSLKLWDLTVFRFAGEYLEKVVRQLENRKSVPPKIIRRLIKGLNRVFTGMAAENVDELFLATGITSSYAGVSSLLQATVKRLSKGSRINVVLKDGQPMLRVPIERTYGRDSNFKLNLTRFEFLSRVAEGVLPGSFSNQLYVDVLDFKSRLLSDLAAQDDEFEDDSGELVIDTLTLDGQGRLQTESVYAMMPHA